MDQQPHLYKYYINTQSRAQEIFVGVFFGLHYYDYAKKNYKLNVYWLCEKCPILKYVIIGYGLHLFKWTIEFNQPMHDWLVLGKLYICASAGLIVTPACTNGDFWLKDFYNIRLFQILGKLSFGGYLFHFGIAEAVRYTQNDLAPVFSMPLVKETTMKTLFYTYIVSTFYYCVLEKPIGAIEAHFSKRKPQEKKEDKAAENAKSELELSTKVSTKKEDTYRKIEPIAQDSSPGLDPESELIIKKDVLEVENQALEVRDRELDDTGEFIY